MKRFMLYMWMLKRICECVFTLYTGTGTSACFFIMCDCVCVCISQGGSTQGSGRFSSCLRQSSSCGRNCVRSKRGERIGAKDWMLQKLKEGRCRVCVSLCVCAPHIAPRIDSDFRYAWKKMVP